MKKETETEMYCLECGTIDESYTAHCIKHGRSAHGLRDKKTKEDLK